MKPPPTLRATCGTNAGWNAHSKHRERPCMPCKVAHAEYQDEWRHRTGRNKARLYTDAEVYAIRNETAVKLQDLIHESESRRGALYCRVTTNELRRALGMDTENWPPPRQLPTDTQAAPHRGGFPIPKGEQ